jgi:hypothetical protein
VVQRKKCLILNFMIAFLTACSSFYSDVALESSAAQQPTPTKTSIPELTEAPTYTPQSPYKDLGWWQYIHHEYRFSLWLPMDWAVIETTTGNPQMSGHMLSLQPYPDEGIHSSIRITFRRIGDTFPLWPSGVGAGSFEPDGTLLIMEQPARRMAFICPDGETDSIWYHGQTEPNIQRGELEFGFILNNVGIYCEPGFSINEKEQRVAEKIITSLSVP